VKEGNESLSWSELPSGEDSLADWLGFSRRFYLRQFFGIRKGGKGLRNRLSCTPPSFVRLPIKIFSLGFLSDCGTGGYGSVAEGMFLHFLY